MSRFSNFILLFLSLPLLLSAKDDGSVNFMFTVKDAQLGYALPEARLIPYDSLGNPGDTVKVFYHRFQGRLYEEEESHFSFSLPRREGLYNFDVVCPRYETQTVTYRLDKSKFKESYITLPPVMMERESRKLGEVTVTTSKIKFYHKGDTLVYNADAFQLAEGSMLDALIAQLPGVELKKGGQITVNGEYVEELLLNGREFMSDDRRVMLENIGAYTVKDIQVYQGQTLEEKWRGDPNVRRRLTMDVKLKKEYSTGLTLNAQGGYGTHGRYMGRLFTSWMSPTLRLNFIGNVNNLNDNRDPGKDDSWTPDMMPSDTREYRTLSANYSYRPLDESADCRGSVDFYQSIADMRTNGTVTNFLPGGNTFEYMFSGLRYNHLRVTTTHHLNTFSLGGKRMRLGLFAKGGYTRNTSRSSSLSASFNEEQDSVTREMLEAIYETGTPKSLKALINRSGTRSDAGSSDWNAQLFPLIEWKMPGGKSVINYELGFKYHSIKDDNWNDYVINYGDNPVAATRRRQYVDNTPNSELSSIHNITWSTFVRSVTLAVNYEYRFEDTHRDSYMYALERLGEDMGVYGVVPAGYLETLDPDNSYRSRIMLNRHTLSPKISWNYIAPNKARLSVYCYPEISIQHRHMDYYRSGREYPVKRTSVIASLPANRFKAEVGWGYAPDDKRGLVPRNKIGFTSSITTRTPDLHHMVDIVSDANPLDISLGNPDLRNSYSFTNSLRWQFNHLSRHLINVVSLSATNVLDELVRGYTYESATGIRRNRTYNVDGNRDFGMEEYLSYQFGTKNQFELSYNGAATFSRSADMVGENAIEPVRTTADNRFLEQTLRFGYTIGKQHLMLKGSWTGRHTTSDRVNIGTIDADHLSAGVIGQFNLTHGFGLNTDFTVYRRSGYGMSEIDRTDPIWNMRLTYTPPGGHWVVMADGFDLLHRLTNVNYSVDATGRVVTYSNALPRYFMLSVQYRFNRQPKGRNRR